MGERAMPCILKTVSRPPIQLPHSHILDTQVSSALTRLSSLLLSVELSSPELHVLLSARLLVILTSIKTES